MREKILIAVDGRELVKNRTTGIGRALQLILDSIPILKPEWEFLVILNQHCAPPRPRPNVRSVYIKEKVALLADQVQIPLLLRNHKVDLFFSSYYKCPIFSRVPAIITIHDLINLTVPQYYRRNPAHLLLYKIMARKAVRIITVSLNSAKDISVILKTPRDKISVVLWDLSDEFSPCGKESIVPVLNKYGITKPYLLHVGNANPHKNIPRMLAAFETLPAAIKDTHQFVLAGSDRSKVALPADTDKIFTGQISNEELRALYCGARLFVFPSLYEGFGFPPLEAMACGCPVVSSNTSCMPEILGNACLYFDPENAADMADKIKTVLTDPALSGQLTAKGLENAKRYSNGDMARNITAVINEVTSLRK